jgi:Secretion system C-terminal sorting domain
MKLKLLFLFTVISSVQLFAQTGVPVPSIGNNFISGISPVINSISIAGLPAGTHYVDFYATNTTYTTVYSSQIDNIGGGPWLWNVNMGQFLPGTVIWAECFDINRTPLDYTNDYSPLIAPQPFWLQQGGQVLSVSESGNVLFINARLPVSVISNQSIPSSVTAIGNRPFNIGNYGMDFSASYNMSTGFASATGSGLGLSLNTLNLSQSNWTFPFDNNGLVQIDNGFNIAIIDSASYTPFSYSCQIPGMKFPVGSFASIRVDAGISFNAEVKAVLVYGPDQVTGNYGFIDYNGEKTRAVVKAEGAGFIRGKVSVLGGIASATGTLTATGRIGAGYTYVSEPSVAINPVFGGDLNITGTVKLQTFWGFGPSTTYGPRNFYNRSFGPNAYNSLRTIDQRSDLWNGSRAITYQTNATLSMLGNYPQPAFGTRDNLLYTVWVENDVLMNGYLLFSKLDPTGNSFSPNLLVELNDYSISNPKVAIMPSGSAVITWTQNRYSETTLPVNADEDDMRQASDVWGAVYDVSTDAIEYVFRLSDDTSSIQAGRAEGQANIKMGTGTNGLITWVSKDLTGETTDIWYTEISESSNQWLLTTPAKLADLPGVNSDVEIAYTDSVNALAVWINDPDGADSTLNNQLVFATWDGITWSIADILSANFGSTDHEELSMDYNDGYCMITWTSTEYSSNGDFEKRLDIAIWDDIIGDWSGFYYDSDSSSAFYKPRASISDNGIASICYQVIDLYADTSAVDPGIIYLYVKDLNTANGWVEISGNPFVSDPTTYIWEMDAGFGDNNRFYTLTQEIGPNGPVQNPSNGILFGDPDLSMVLRGLQINSNLTISDINEPGNIPTGYPKIAPRPFSIDLVQNFPNPFSQSTTIEYTLREEGYLSLQVFDITGRMITELYNGNLSPGVYRTEFDAGNLPSGMYFCKLTFNGQSTTKNMMLIRE